MRPKLLVMVCLLVQENNELHANLRKSQGDLAKVKDKAARLEKEVDKLRAALGVEGGADEVLRMLAYA